MGQCGYHYAGEFVEHCNLDADPEPDTITFTHAFTDPDRVAITFTHALANPDRVAITFTHVLTDSDRVAVIFAHALTDSNRVAFANVLTDSQPHSVSSPDPSPALGA
jgi:hypothetical protein